MIDTHKSDSLAILQRSLALVVVLTMLGMFVVFLLNGQPAMLMIGLAVCAFGIATVPTLVSGRYDLFHPFNFVAMTTLIGVTLRTMYIVLVDNDITRYFLMLGKPLEVLEPALILIVLSLLCLVLGFFVDFPVPKLERLSLIRHEHWQRRRLTVLLIIMTLIAAVAMTLYFQRLGINMASLAERLSGKRRLVLDDAEYQYAALGYYRWGASLLAYAFYTIMAYFAASKARFTSPLGLLVLAFAVAASFFPLVTSSRTAIIFLVVYALLCWHYLRQRIAAKTLFIAVGLVMVLVTSLGVLRGAGGQLREEVWTFDAEGMVEAVLGNRNLFGIDKTAHIVEAVPEMMPYAMGSTLFRWVLAPIPRTVWREKPVMRVGTIIGAEVYRQDRDITGVPPGFVAELFWNFGYGGVFVGMFLLGVWLKFLYKTFGPHLRNKNAVMLYIGILLPFSYNLLGGDVTGTMVSMILDTVTVLLILLFVSSAPLVVTAPAKGRL